MKRDTMLVVGAVFLIFLGAFAATAPRLMNSDSKKFKDVQEAADATFALGEEKEDYTVLAANKNIYGEAPMQGVYRSNWTKNDRVHVLSVQYRIQDGKNTRDLEQVQFRAWGNTSTEGSLEKTLQVELNEVMKPEIGSMDCDKTLTQDNRAKILCGPAVKKKDDRIYRMWARGVLVSGSKASIDVAGCVSPEDENMDKDDFRCLR